MEINYQDLGQQATQHQNSFDGLQKWQFYSYGVGHFMNDLGGAIYFNYLLYFLKRVVGTVSAPAAFLAGQIADGIATPLVGLLSDKTNTRFGKRMPWYIGGFVIFLIGYFPIYQNIKRIRPGISPEGQTLYYVMFMCVVNLGWAAVQISHMSLVASLTYSIRRRDRLNNLRNSFTFLSNLIILSMGIIFFALMNDSTNQINALSYIAASIGIPAGIFFVLGINQPKLSRIAQTKLNNILKQHPQYSSKKVQVQEEEFRFRDWFRMPKFYIYGLCYMGVRLYCNLLGTLLPFYLVDVLQIGDKTQIQNNQIPFQVAIVGLILYLSQYVTSMFTNKIYRKYGRKKALASGLFLASVSSIAMVFINPSSSGVMYFIAILIGSAGALVLSTGINLISDIVGFKSKKGAVVYGIYSLLDKFASGLAIFFITGSSHFEKSVQFTKWVIILVPSVACILSCAMVLQGPVKQYTFNDGNGSAEAKSLIDELAI